jgi:hypothetical protein
MAARRIVAFWLPARRRAGLKSRPHAPEGGNMLLVVINILIICVVGTILFWLIDKFVRDGRLANLLKILVGLICLAAVLRHLLPFLGLSDLL